MAGIKDVIYETPHKAVENSPACASPEEDNPTTKKVLKNKPCKCNTPVNSSTLKKQQNEISLGMFGNYYSFIEAWNTIDRLFQNTNEIIG